MSHLTKVKDKGLSRSWRIQKQHVSAYTGGKVEVSNNEEFLASQCNLDVKLLDWNTGLVTQSIKAMDKAVEAEELMTFALSPNNRELVTASRNLLIRSWDLVEKKCTNSFKAHKSPALSMDFDPSGTLIATGGSDKVVLVHDFAKGHCTHKFVGHDGIISLVKFHPIAGRLQLFTCSDDCTVRIWDLVTYKCVAVLRSHMSSVTSLGFSNDGYTMLTAGRDKVVNVWNLRDFSLLKTVPMYEVLEGIHVLPPNPNLKQISDKKKTKKRDIQFVTAGEKGILKVWSLYAEGARWRCKMIMNESDNKSEKNQRKRKYKVEYTNLFCRTNAAEIVVVTSDQMFMSMDIKPAAVNPIPNDLQLPSLDLKKQFVGFNDEIIDIKMIPPNPNPNPKTQSNMIVMATNSVNARILSSDTFDCALLSGHSDVVLAVSVSPCGRLVATSSKDHSARVWDVFSRRCVAICEGHTDAVGAVSFPSRITSVSSSSAWLSTGSKDLTLKLWDLRSVISQQDKMDKLRKLRENVKNGITKTPTEVDVFNNVLKLNTMFNQIAHEKDINAITVAPNDKIIASASQDKSIKIWCIERGESLATLKGHKRGIWAAQFSPIDRCLVSGSADRTVKVWSMQGQYPCIATFEGHTSSVLRVKFFNAGMQIVSTGADGLMKLWTLKTNECANTFEAHDDKIWALDISKNGKKIITGGADSSLKVWEDCTIEEDDNVVKEREEELLQEQKLMTLVYKKKNLRAAKMALELDKPQQLRNLLDIMMAAAAEQSYVEKSRSNNDKQIIASQKRFHMALNTLINIRPKVIAKSPDKVGKDCVTPSAGGGATSTILEPSAKTDKYGHILDSEIENHEDVEEEEEDNKEEYLYRLLKYARDWNMNSRHSALAQQVIQFVLQNVPHDRLATVPGINSIAEAQLAYSQRHFKRISQLCQTACLVEYTLSAMTDGVEGEPESVIKSDVEEKSSKNTNDANDDNDANKEANGRHVMKETVGKKKVVGVLQTQTLSIKKLKKEKMKKKRKRTPGPTKTNNHLVVTRGKRTKRQIAREKAENAKQ